MRLDVQHGPWDNRLAGRAECFLNGRKVEHVSMADDCVGLVRCLHLDGNGEPVKLPGDRFEERYLRGEVKITFKDREAERIAKRVQLTPAIRRALHGDL